MKKLIFLAMLLASSARSTSSDDAASRLRAARSFRCNFTSTVTTWVRSGHRTTEQISDKGSAVYDNIDVAKGTARIVANNGASDVVVWVERTSGSLWLRERTPSGNEIVTTIFPMYAEGTEAFVVLEARHSMVGQIVLGQDSFGTCIVLE
jgi:hypothetical protein